MRRVFILLLGLLAGCREEVLTAKQRPFDGAAFLTRTLIVARGVQEVAAIADRKAHTPQGRELALAMQRDARTMFADLATIARRRDVPLPAAIEERKLALKGNLAILTGADVDRAFALAMVQETSAISQSLRAVLTSGDPQLVEFANRHLPTLAQRHKQSNNVLNQLGGSPFGFVP